jgi:hypothetical protein
MKSRQNQIRIFGKIIKVNNSLFAPRAGRCADPCRGVERSDSNSRLNKTTLWQALLLLETEPLHVTASLKNNPKQQIRIKSHCKINFFSQSSPSRCRLIVYPELNSLAVKLGFTDKGKSKTRPQISFGHRTQLERI